MIGETIGPYRIIEQIGAGGMATVFKAYEPGIDRYVALKLLPAQYYHDPQFRKRFEREAKAVARLEHMNILPVYAYGEDRGHMYMAMRLMPWGTLSQRIRTLGCLPLEECARTLGQIASALDYAHSQGVMHRDVKPANVLLDQGGNAYLTDFGIARIVADSALTSSGVIMGTPAYMAPEQCQAAADVTPAADQYALGVILYEMLTGRVPFQAETPLAVVLMQLNDPLPLPRQFRPEISEEIERVLMKALAKRPEDRFANCVTMAAMFNTALVATPAPGALRGPSSTLMEQTLTSAMHSPEPAPAPAAMGPTARGALPAAGPTRQQASRKPMRWFWPLIGLALLALAAAGLVLIFGGNLGELLRGGAAGPDAASSAAATPCPGVAYRVNVGDTADTVAAAYGISVDELVAFNRAANPDFDPAILGLGQVIQVPQCEAAAARYPWEAGSVPAGTEVWVDSCANHDLGDGVCYFSWREARLLGQVLEYRGRALSVVWSPDGREIAIEGFNGAGLISGLYIANPDGTDIREVFPPGVTNVVWPSWSPDGRWIAFHCGGELCIIHPDGTGFQHLGRAQCFMEPDWAADSQSLYVRRTDSCEDSVPQRVRIERWNLEGGQHEELASFEINRRDCLYGKLSVSPDGTELAYTGAECQNIVMYLDDERIEAAPFSPDLWSDQLFVMP